ncbi:DUF7833 domain-containing protein [Leeuwenhoekiella nanhaiensis]|nr:hypothetical protein [Leeuwenhoekiella nanhaiensis]
MSQLGYTWYPQDWWTSETFKRLKRFPMVRYALRELFDLMYKEGEPVEMNRDFIYDDYNIELSDLEYQKLMEYIDVQPNGKWWINNIKKRISKAEAARENGKKGGRPKKPKNPEKKPKTETQETPLYKEKEKEKVKEKHEVENKEGVFKNIDALKNDYLNDQKLCNAITQTLKLKSRHQLEELLREFNQHLTSTGSHAKSWSDYTSHFLNWNRRKKDIEVKNQVGSGYNVPIG